MHITDRLGALERALDETRAQLAALDDARRDLVEQILRLEGAVALAKEIAASEGKPGQLRLAEGG